MIREFFNVRVAVVFFVLWAILYLALWIWIKSPKTKQRRWLRHSRVPFLAAGMAGTACLIVVFILSFL